MTSISSLETVTPHPLPSLPPSPSAEEDLGRPHAWEDSSDSQPSLVAQGKQRQSQDAYVDGSSDEALDSPDAYPPVNDDQAETRRVQENLRRWEIAERQRRKAARDSTADPQALSLVADVGRRASLLWSGRKPRHSSNSVLGTHTALKSRDSVDVLPMDDIAVTPTPSPTHSENPFSNPPSAVSPFADPPGMEESSEPPSASESPDDAAQIAASHDRPALLTASSSFRRPPTPKPLGLPPPRSPPPPVAPPILSPPPLVEHEEDSKQTRWWHEWLCGCGEGSDRGGDNQAGRTNPFE